MSAASKAYAPRQPAQQRQATVLGLTRARRRQLLVDYAWQGLFWGLLAGCATVAATRLGWLLFPYPTAVVVGVLIATALLISVLLAWRHRPDDLQVAILADVQLRLRQRLSTAWEYARNADSNSNNNNNNNNATTTLNERLAEQAVRARLPARPAAVFPSRLTVWGRLVPIVATLLLLLWVTEQHPDTSTSIRSEDAAAIAEQGERLREYGRQMAVRAEREQLPRSAEAAKQMRRLGNRMSGGGLNRDQALQRLRRLSSALDDQRLAALQAGSNSETQVDLRASDAGAATLTIPQFIASPRLRLTLQDLSEQRIAAGDARFSEADADTLKRLGVTPEQLQQALDDLAAGDGQRIEQILQTLSDAEQRAREAAELEQARRRVNQARDNLGDDNATANDGQAAAAASSASENIGGRDSADSNGTYSTPGDAGGGLGSGSGYGSPNSNEARRANRSAPDTDSTPPAAALKPVSQFRQGEVFSARVRALPRDSRPTLDAVELAPQFDRQVEQALAKDDYPFHQKELIRNYFLSLSRGSARKNSSPSSDNNRATEPRP